MKGFASVVKKISFPQVKFSTLALSYARYYNKSINKLNKKVMNKQITIFAIIFLIAGFAWLKFTNKLDEQRHTAYENCEPMVDIDGNDQIVCKD